MLKVDGLSVRYGRVQAVHEASFEVREGEFVGIIGSNGAGKSSLLNAISGAVSSAAGRVEFEGRDVTRLAPERIAALGMMLVPEGRQTFTWLTVEENLKVGASIQKDKEVGEREIERQLERFPILKEFYRRPAGALSGGQQQQLVIARSLVASPRLLMLDEPSLGLAPKLINDVLNILSELRDQGVTILLVEQNAAQTVKRSDRVYVMRNGKLSEAEGSSLSAEELVNTYLGSGR